MSSLRDLKSISLDNCNILVVDDSRNNAFLLKSILSKQGYRTTIANNGKGALESISQHIPDLILLDIMMPDMDGFAVCGKLKSDPELTHIPVIFITGKTDVKDKIKGIQIGGADYITKPFDASEVIARVETHLKLKKAIESIDLHNKNLEEMLEERTRELIQAERHAAFSLLIQGIVHNLKNPLQVISGRSQLISAELDHMNEVISKNGSIEIAHLNGFKKSIQNHNECINTGYITLLDMINSLMRKSRSDKIKELQVLNLNSLIKQEISFLEGNLQFKNKVRKVINFCDNKLIVEVVSSEIAQVFHNIVSNALDAVCENENPEIRIETGSNKNNVWFSVSDNGVGISPDHLPRIYDPFYTTKTNTDVSENNTPKGTGLGLYICSETVKSYGGKIEEDSSPGKGTKFIIKLPKFSMRNSVIKDEHQIR